MDAEFNNGFGPISKKRGRRAQTFAAFLLMVCLIVVHSHSNNGYTEIVQLLFCIVAAIVGEVLKNICLFIEEIFHLRGR